MADVLIERKRIKIAQNLFKVGDVYRYRKGDDEKTLGQFKSDEAAIKAKDAYEATRQKLGEKAFKVRLKHVFKEYREDRRKQVEEPIPGRRPLAKGTLKEIDYIWDKHLVRFWGNHFFAEVDDPEWTRYCEKATVADLKNHRKVFGGFLRWCKKKGLVKVLPEFEIPQVQVRKRPILTPDQMKALIANARGKTLLFVSLYLFMGMRRGEQMHLRWEDIDFENRALYVRDETTRTRKGRPIPINEFCYQVLLQTLNLQQKKKWQTPWVYPMRGNHERHMRPDGISKGWQLALKRAGLRGLEPHDLRATFEYYANKRAEFTDMQREKMAGASIKIQSQRYVTFNADDVRGLEESVKFEGLNEALNSRLQIGSAKTKDGKKAGNQIVKADTEG